MSKSSEYLYQCMDVMKADRDVSEETKVIMFIEYAKLVVEELWVKYDWNKPDSRPQKTGRYFVRRKDGKIHWEKWNGSGWAYNGDVITHFQAIIPPKK